MNGATKYRQPKRRYFRKSLGKKKAYSRISRVNRLLKTDFQMVKATSVDGIYIPQGGTVYWFGSSSQPYKHIAAMLVSSPEFVSRQNQYSYFKLSGMEVILTRKWLDPISYGENNVSPGFLQTQYHNGLEMVSLNLYPNLLSTNVGQSVENADSSWSVSPFIHGAQRHYIPFPKGFTTGSNSIGLGVWNSCLTVNSMNGELAIYNSGQGVQASNMSLIMIWDVEINLYAQFCNNTGA